MARPVGNIEITVDADTGKLQATLTKGAKKGGEAAAKIIERELGNLEANLAEIDGRREAEVARKQIEGVLRGMEGTVDLDLSEARASLKEFEEQAEAVRLVLNTDIELSPEDLAEIRADFRRTKEIIERNAIEVEMNLALDEAQVENERLRAQTQLEDMKIHAEMELALSEAILDAERFRLQQEADELEMQLALHMAVAEAEITRFREAQEADDIDLEVDVHEGSGFGGHWAKIAAGVIALGENIAVALEGATAAATSVLSSGFQAVGGAAGAAVPLVAAFGAAITASIVGTRGFKDALSAVNEEFAAAQAAGRPMNMALVESSEAMRNLAPSATEAALAFAGIRDELSDLRIVVQDDLFAGMADSIESLADTALPSIQDGLRVAAQSVNDFGRELADVAANTDFKAMIEALDPALDDALDSGIALSKTIEPFLMAAAPAAERLAEMIERGAEAFQKWTVLNPDKIAEFLDDGLTSLERWTELLQSTGDLLVTIFDAGSESGDGFVIGLNNIIERWDGFLSSTEGQAGLEDFFDTGREAMEAMKPVLEALKDAFGTLVDDDAISQFQTLGESLATVIGVIAQVMEILSDMQITTAIASLAEVIGVIATAINAIVPDALLQFVGVVIVATKVTALLSPVILSVQAAMLGLGPAAAAGATGIEGLSLALKGLVATNLPLLAVAAAVTAVVLAFQIFGDSQNDAKERTDELTIALQNEVDALISSGEAAGTAADGFKALNNAIFETGDGGDKINEAFQLINEGAGDMQLGVQDSVRVMTDLKGEADATIPALTGLAEGYGLSGDAAAEMAKLVANTDDNMSDAAIPTTDLGLAMTDLAEKTGLPRDQIVALFGSLEELQDQAENTNIDQMAAGFLNAASTMEGLEGEIWATVDAMRNNGEIVDDNVVAYTKYVELLAEAKLAADDASSANENQAASTILVQNAINDAIAAHEAEAVALAASRKEAMDKWKAEVQLAEATADAAVEIVAATHASKRHADQMRDSATELEEFGSAMRTAAGEAEALNNALDLLLNPFLGLQEAEAAVKQNTDDLTESLMGGADVIKLREDAWTTAAEGDQAAANAINATADALAAQNKTLDLNTQAGRDNAEQIRTGITGITDFAAAQLTANVATEEVVASANAARDALIAQAAGFFTTSEAAGTAEQQATDYINALGLTPELVNTVFSQPGLIDALLNAEDLTLLYDDAGNPVITEFEAAGIDPAMADVSGFKGLVESLDTVTGQPTIAAPTIPDVQTGVETLQTDTEALGETTAVPAVEMPTAAGIITTTETMQTGLDTLGDTSVTPTVSIPGLQTTIDKVNELKVSIDKLPTSKTITITTNNVSTGGSMTGSIVTGPRTLDVGERGYAEAIVPLQLPLNRVDPSVRQFAEILRGGSSPGQIHPGTGKIVNNYMTIQPVSADPSAVATQVINRSAEMANRS